MSPYDLRKLLLGHLAQPDERDLPDALREKLATLRRESASAPPCPRCGTVPPKHVAYGFPIAFPDALRSEIELGGCIPSGARWCCRSCGAHYS